MARISYFAEERCRKNNPNFYVNMKPDDLRRQVKRIVRDLGNGLVDEQDYNYLRNDKIISVCINESYNQLKSAQSNHMAMSYYVNEKLANNITMYPNINIIEERMRVNMELTKLQNKIGVWMAANDFFTLIINGVDIKEALYRTLLPINNNLFYDL